MEADSSPPGPDIVYMSTPLTYTQPAWLAAQARLRGLSAPDPETASVLEIGAASGGNLIPLAARFPRARFLGLDLAARDVAIGQARIRALGLSNIELVCADVRAYRADAPFEFVLCNGVYSWVPAEARAAILRLAASALAGDGIAAISYNVLPGAHLRLAVRSACRALVDRQAPAFEQAARVRRALAQLVEAPEPAGAYGALLRAEAERLRRRPASYILGEILADVNDPCRFTDFAAAAQDAGLAVLGEADLPSALHAEGGSEAARRAQDLARAGPADFETALDIVTGRPFRRTLLVRDGRSIEAPRAARLAGLHLAAPLRSENGRILDGRGRPATPPSAATAAAFAALGAAYPATVPAEELAGGAPDVAAALFDLAAAGQATVSAAPLVVGRALNDRPRMFAVAREEAQAVQPWVSSLQHAPVLIDATLRALAPLMDGAHTRDALLGAVARTGAVDPQAELARALAYAERAALIEP